MAGSCLALANWPWSRQMANWRTGKLEELQLELPTQIQSKPRRERSLSWPHGQRWFKTIKYRKSMKWPKMLRSSLLFGVPLKIKLKKKNCTNAINQMVMCQSIIIVCGCLVRLKGVG